MLTLNLDIPSFRHSFFILIVLLGCSQFGFAQDFEQGPFTGNRFGAVTPADVNNDGKVDLVGLVYIGFDGKALIRIQVNTTEGDDIQFELFDYETMDVAGMPAVGDFNNDGSTDIFTYNSKTSALTVLLNDGNLNFTESVIGSGSDLNFKAADLDMDGNIDVVGYRQYESTILVYLNNGDGTFTTFSIETGNGDLSIMEIVDIDLDQDLDIIVGGGGFRESVVQILENQDAVFFSKTIFDGAPGELHHLDVADINGDDKVDVVFSSGRTSTLNGLIQGENLEFELQGAANNQSRYGVVAIADFNNDGLSDIVSGSNDADMLYHKNISTSTIAFESETISGIRPLFSLEAVDLDGDADLDIVATNGEFWWLENITLIDLDEDGFDSRVDCDDTNASINPNATEIANNEIDENCDGTIEIIDEDEDGFNSDEDCNDNDALINPNATEVLNNDIDEDCNGVADQDDTDGDGFNSDEDCDNNDASINPNAEEIPNNEIDENCDGIVVWSDDDNDGFDTRVDCDDSNPNINPDAIEVVNNGVDDDCDGVIEEIDEDGDGFNSDQDCDDTNANVFPFAVEIANNGIDEDCDGADVIANALQVGTFSVAVYPNPGIDNLTINLYGDFREVELRIWSVTGKLISQEILNSNNQIDTSHLPNGINLVEILQLDSRQRTYIKYLKVSQ